MDLLKPTYLTPAQIEEEANKISTQFDFNPRRASIRELVKKIGGNLEVLPIDETEKLASGSLKVFGPGDFTMYFCRLEWEIACDFGDRLEWH
jgi:hypothetical protein